MIFLFFHFFVYNILAIYLLRCIFNFTTNLNVTKLIRFISKVVIFILWVCVFGFIIPSNSAYFAVLDKYILNTNAEYHCVYTRLRDGDIFYMNDFGNVGNLGYFVTDIEKNNEVSSDKNLHTIHTKSVSVLMVPYRSGEYECGFY
jgi:hypothetical protein